MGTSHPYKTCLQHLHNKALQIARLRHAGEDRMVGGLTSLFNEADVSLGVVRRPTLPLK